MAFARTTDALNPVNTRDKAKPKLLIKKCNLWPSFCFQIYAEAVIHYRVIEAVRLSKGTLPNRNDSFANMK
jgi:hypothetical protein